MTYGNPIAQTQANPSYGTPLTQDSIDLYWSIYKNLEKEILSISDVIFINDDQRNVYSVRIAELIIRTSAEIESLCKDLFATLGVNFNGQTLYFDDHCISEFERRWGIESKVIKIIHPYIRFSEKELRPFKNATIRTYQTDEPNPWKLAYNDVKHNLRNRLSNATIGTLIEAMAALYLLNVYSKGYNHEISLPSRTEAKNFDASLGSSIFAVKVQKTFDAKSIGADKIVKHDFIYQPECTYRIDPANDSLELIHQKMRDIAKDAMTEIVPAVKGLVKSGELQIPTQGKLDDHAISSISLKANMIAMNRHAKDFSEVIASMKYTASLVEKPSPK